jgi:RAB protein geranylgeranyltransferase component A
MPMAFQNRSLVFFFYINENAQIVQFVQKNCVQTAKEEINDPLTFPKRTKQVEYELVAASCSLPTHLHRNRNRNRNELISTQQDETASFIMK